MLSRCKKLKSSALYKESSEYITITSYIETREKRNPCWTFEERDCSFKSLKVKTETTILSKLILKF